MPTCPNCETGFDYKSGMVCPACDFDFKRYWFVSWKLLHFKFHSAERSLRSKAVTMFWLCVPTITAIALGLTIYRWAHPVLAIAFFIAFIVPITLLFTILPICALLREDRLRHVKETRHQKR
jgi:hypothetical protein